MHPPDETQMHKSQMALLGHLSAHLVHELSNVLGSVMGHAELAKRHASDEDIAERLEKVMQSSSLATDLTRDFLDFMSPSEEKASGDISEATNTVCELLDYWISKQSIELRLDIPDDLPRVATSTRSVELVLANVLKNALEASRQASDPVLEVKAVPIEGFVYVKVWNNGTSIPEEHLQNINEPFFTTKDEKDGHGLGLALVWKLVYQAGGEVSMRNAECGGVEVNIRLPVAMSEERNESSVALQQPEKPVPSGESGGHGRVLVVDDEGSARHVLRLMLGEMSYQEIETCASGSEALEKVRNESFDAVLLDLRMPDLTGEDVFQRLPDSLQRRVVFVTGDVLNTSRRQFLSRAAQPALLKPIRYQELSKAMKKVAPN